MEFEERYMDVLQNLEFAIVQIYKRSREMTDYNVMRMLQALIDEYQSELSGLPPKAHDLSEIERALQESVRQMCEFRLGRASLGNNPSSEAEMKGDNISIEEILLCLKRLFKSAKRWNKSGGRRGYLDFIIQYVK